MYYVSKRMEIVVTQNYPYLGPETFTSRKLF